MPPANSDDDLDDLDEVLEQFNPTQRPSTHQPSTSSAPVPTPALAVPPVEDEETKAFREALEKMLLENFEGISTDKNKNPEEAKAMKEIKDNWEKMLIEDLEGDGRGNSLFAAGSSSGSVAGQPTSKETMSSADKEDPFQKVIRQAMEKLKSSDDALKTDSKGLPEDDSLENLLSSLGDLNLEGEDGEGLESMLESMMSQLMSKEILYDPLKELDTKYPGYLTEHATTLSKEDLTRYTAQKVKVSAIIAIFEDPSYSDDNSTQAAEILKCMNEMQSYGSPPPEIMGDMPPEFEFGSDGLPKLSDGCAIM